ncbi:MAG: hypothetical protein P8J87_05380 [Verrucomicrobiales bacterium]|nr:hypothetical protein [Verrucomicrobiales bacterium]
MGAAEEDGSAAVVDWFEGEVFLRGAWEVGFFEVVSEDWFGADEEGGAGGLGSGAIGGC